MPGLRRLRDPLRRPGLLPRARHRAGEHRLRHRHRLRRPLLLLHGHLRDARHPRPRARAGHRHRRRARRPVDLDRHRRRRRAVDRRQPPDPRAAPQRAGQDPALQQPDLRADQGPGVADVRGRQDHEVDAVRLDRRPVQPGRRWRSAPRRRSSPARSTPTRSTCPRCCAPPPRTRARRSSRSTRTAPSSTTARSTRCATRRPNAINAIRLEHGEPITFNGGTRQVVRDAGRRAADHGRRRRRAARPRRAPRGPEPRLRAVAPEQRARPARRRSASSARSSARSHGDELTRQLAPPRVGAATSSTRCCTPATPGPSRSLHRVPFLPAQPARGQLPDLREGEGAAPPRARTAAQARAAPAPAPRPQASSRSSSPARPTTATATTSPRRQGDG